MRTRAAAPGTLWFDKPAKRLFARAADGWVELLEVQRAMKRTTTGLSFANGYHVGHGTHAFTAEAAGNSDAQASGAQGKEAQAGEVRGKGVWEREAQGSEPQRN